MQWFSGTDQKKITHSAMSQTVVKSETASETVVEYTPQQFIVTTPPQALNYLDQKEAGSDFIMSEPSRVQTGLDEIERQSKEDQIENLVIERLKDVQESAYKEAYQLGLEEGKAEAFRKHSQHILDDLEKLGQLLLSIESLKKDLVAHNESHLIKLLFSMAGRLAGAQLAAQPEGLIHIIKSAVELAQDEENVKLHVAPEQVEFIESLKKQNQREFEFLKRTKIEPDASVQAGGCVIETNYGEVDARIEQRTAKLWETLADHLPRVSDKIGG